MRPQENIEPPVLDTTSRLSSLSIVVDDFDSIKTSPTTINSNNCSNKEAKLSSETTSTQLSSKPYTRKTSDESIKKILEEAEHRKHEFWKLIDEHSAVIENLKKIEKQEPSVCKTTIRI